MNKPMNTAEFFTKICKILKEKNMVPEGLDYWLPISDPVPIETYMFDFNSRLNYGGSEGIYLQLYINIDDPDSRQGIFQLGTFKTLNRSREAMYDMAHLLADFTVEATDYVNSNLDDFTWVGFDVDAKDENGENKAGYTCRSEERAMNRKDALLEKYPVVVVRNNHTRKETVYKQDNQIR